LKGSLKHIGSSCYLRSERKWVRKLPQGRQT
jgi:hypothetical protein